MLLTFYGITYCFPIQILLLDIQKVITFFLVPFVEISLRKLGEIYVRINYNLIFSSNKYLIWEMCKYLDKFK